jgi:hypothetical protein
MVGTPVARTGLGPTREHVALSGRGLSEEAMRPVQEGSRMRRILLALFTLTFVLVGGVVTQSAFARPVGATALTFPVTGTFSTGSGVPGVAFAGTVTVNSFGVQDGQLTVQGALAAADDSLFSPFAVTIPAYATASEDPQSGCSIVITTGGAFIESGFLVYLDGGAQVTLSETSDPEAARELCQVVSTSARDPGDQQALARTLNRVLGAL